MDKVIGLIISVLVSFLIVGCNPDLHLMPITTSSEEARELYLQGMDFVEEWKIDYSDSLFKRAIELDSQFALAYFQLSDYQGIKRAAELVDLVSEGEAYLIRAKKAYFDRNHPLCDSFIDKLLSRHPKDPYAWYYASHTLHNRDTSKAIKYLEKALRVDEYYAPAYSRLGRLKIEQENYQEAAIAFSTYLNYMPYSANAQDNYGDCMQLMGDYNTAIMHYQRALQSNSDFYLAHWKIAFLSTLRSDYQLALFHAECLLASESAWARFLGWNALANLPYLGNELGKAISILDSCAFSFRQSGDWNYEISIMIEKGWFLLMESQWDWARSAFESASELATDYFEQDKINQTLLIFAEGCVGLVYGEHGDLITAGKQLTKVQEVYNTQMEINSDRIFLSMLEGALSYYSGDYERAIEILRPEADRTSMTSRYFLARAYEAAGLTELSIRYYARLATLFRSPHFSSVFYRFSKNKVEELTKNSQL